MTAVALPFPARFRRRAATLIAALALCAAALLAPATADALTYCVKPATGACQQTVPSIDKAIAAPDSQPGNDQVIVRSGSKQHTLPLTEPAPIGNPPQPE